MTRELEVTARVEQARGKWRYRGYTRPPFADDTLDCEESVWDFPRPPRLEPVAELLRVAHAGQIVAQTRRGVRILETAGAPTYYFPAENVEVDLLEDLPDQSLCEWKGVSVSLTLKELPDDLPAVGWRYEETFPEFVALQGWYSFYPGLLACYRGDERARPQPGGYYGGWVTDNLTGPFKGGPGSEDW